MTFNFTDAIFLINQVNGSAAPVENSFADGIHYESAEAKEASLYYFNYARVAQPGTEIRGVDSTLVLFRRGDLLAVRIFYLGLLFYNYMCLQSEANGQNIPLNVVYFLQ